MDANMNAQVGLTNPATIGADVYTNFCYSSWRWWTRCRTNLCKREISSVLPSNPLVQVGGKSNYSYFWRPYGSALVCLFLMDTSAC
jgi:glycine dehydrogenase